MNTHEYMRRWMLMEATAGAGGVYYYSDFEDVHVLEYVYSRLTHLKPKLATRVEGILSDRLDMLLSQMANVFAAYLNAHMSGREYPIGTPLQKDAVLKAVRSVWREKLDNDADSYLEYEDDGEEQILFIDSDGFNESEIGASPYDIACALELEDGDTSLDRDSAITAVVNFILTQIESKYGDNAAEMLHQEVAGEGYAGVDSDIAEKYMELSGASKLDLRSKWVLMTLALKTAHVTGGMHEKFGMDADDFEALNNIKVLPTNPDKTYRKLGNGDEVWGEIFWLNELMSKYKLGDFLD